jgi:chemotaxis protein CheX
VQAQHINPFIESVESVFHMMLNTQVKRLKARAGSGSVDRPGQTITSVIGISGTATGVVALSFPRPTALRLATRFLDGGPANLDDEIVDALSEMANMVGGSAKSKFDLDPPPELSLPTVVEGTDYRMKFPTKSVWIEVPFESPEGSFVMEVSFTKD